MKLLFMFILLFIFSINSLNASGFLKTQGKIITDADENEVFLQGMGLGGWLVQEGYMLHTSGFANAEHEVRAKIEQLIGASKTDEFYAKYHKNYVKRVDIDKMAEWGFNSIRLPMHYNKLTPFDQPYVYLEQGFQVIDSLLSWCEANQMYLILDLHAAPGGQSDEPISDYNPSYPSLWESDLNKARTVDLWRKIAERYADKEWIGGYDLINEPKWDLQPNNLPLRNLYVDITNAIREVDTNHILFIEGNWYATDFSGLTPPWDDNMVYSFHKYWNSNDQGAIQYLLSLRETQNVPLWLGETGENSNVWFRECIELMKQNNIGWAWWPHKKLESISVPLSSPISWQFQQLLDYWNGNGSQPSAVFAETALSIMAQNLELSNCTFRPDVIDAMFRQVTSSETIPFTELSVPGIIYATDFDIGRKGSAYQDNDYQNIGGSSWNSGWEYRNDAVDIEKCTDNISNGFNVGWIENTEWMKYTFNVENSGTYNIKLRAASLNGGGLVKLIIDGMAISNLKSITSTGGWQNWQDFIIEGVELTIGTSEITLQSVLGGFNLNYIEFIPVSLTDSTEDLLKPDEFMLFQNYPNPFNGTTKIKVYTPIESEISLKIYNIEGELIKILAQKELVNGEKIYSWDVSKEYQISSGIYFMHAELGGNQFTNKIVYLK